MRSLGWSLYARGLLISRRVHIWSSSLATLRYKRLMPIDLPLQLAVKERDRHFIDGGISTADAASSDSHASVTLPRPSRRLIIYTENYTGKYSWNIVQSKMQNKIQTPRHFKVKLKFSFWPNWTRPDPPALLYIFWPDPARPAGRVKSRTTLAYWLYTELYTMCTVARTKHCELVVLDCNTSVHMIYNVYITIENVLQRILTVILSKCCCGPKFKKSCCGFN